jgi:VIT1/CCC1 family predicted Fe2+/Mn2+ transporter
MSNNPTKSFRNKLADEAGTSDGISGKDYASEISSNSTDHSKNHNILGDYMGDIILGFADGLTVPFALTAGLSAVGSIRIVIVGGLAELFAGAISMGLGAWLAAESDRKAYYVEEAREKREVQEKPVKEEEQIYEILDQYHISRDASKGVVEALVVNEDLWVQFMMDFGLKLPRPNTSKAWISAVMIATSYFLGGLLPMIPYFIFHSIDRALYTSIGVSSVILLSFGYAKAIAIGQNKRNAVFSAVQMLFIGALAAAASYGIVRGLNSALEN